MRLRKSNFAGSKINPTAFHRSQIKFYAILIPMCIFMGIPIIFTVGNAFKSLGELFMFPPSIIPLRPTMINFRTLFLQSSLMAIPMWRFLINTLIVAGATVFLNMLVSVSGGYVLSKKKFRFNAAFFRINQIALMFVPIAVTIPRYLVVSNIGIMNTYFGHILPIVAIPVGLFLVKQFIDQVPDALFEAARIDGANDIFIVKNIVIPMTKPALATLAILSFQMAWGNTETSNLFTTEETMRTLAYFFGAITASASATIGGAGIAAAAGLIMFVPNLIIFIFMQSKVMSTMSHSGIK
jgi:ABC-type glycerol-3-phosphate transport system permease component